jgi:hypothetical protein
MLESVSTGRGDIIAHRKGLELIWIQSIELMEKNLRRLIHEAQANVGLLQMLQERLNIIQDMVYAERYEILGKEQGVSCVFRTVLRTELTIVLLRKSS